MNLRQKKKHHGGPFREWGVEILVQMRAEVDGERFLDRFLTDCVEANGLFFGGGCRLRERTLGGIVELGRTGARIDQRESAVRDWLAGDHEVEHFRIGSRVDLWAE